jgi:integrase
MREQDVCGLRPRDLDRTGPVWAYRPGGHKTEHHGHDRVIFLGRKARAVLAPWLRGVKNDDHVFSPRRATDLANAAKRKKRKTKVQPSQAYRRKANPVRAPGACYRTSSYDHALTKARAKAGVERWTLHQLRHSFGTRARAKYGVEAAQVAMGHATMSAAQIYAEKNLEQARRIAQQMG